MLIWYRQETMSIVILSLNQWAIKNIAILDPFENISMTSPKYKFNKHFKSPNANNYDCVHGPR